MNLQPIEPRLPMFWAKCQTCGERFRSDLEGFADLDGKPFRAYYCDGCKHFLEEAEKGKPSA